MLTKSKWTIEILNRLKQLDFIQDIEFKSPTKDFYDFSINIIVEKEQSKYIKPIVSIINEIEMSIAKEWDKSGELDKKKRFPSVEWEIVAIHYWWLPVLRCWPPLDAHRKNFANHFVLVIFYTEHYMRCKYICQP